MRKSKASPNLMLPGQLLFIWTDKFKLVQFWLSFVSFIEKRSKLMPLEDIENQNSERDTVSGRSAYQNVLKYQK